MPKRDVERGDKLLVRTVDVARHAESAGRFEGKKPVQRGSQRSRRVDSVVARDVVAGQDGENHPQHGLGGFVVFGVIGVGGSNRGSVATRVRLAETAVRIGDGV